MIDESKLFREDKTGHELHGLALANHLRAMWEQLMETVNLLWDDYDEAISANIKAEIQAKIVETMKDATRVAIEHERRFGPI